MDVFLECDLNYGRHPHPHITRITTMKIYAIAAFALFSGTNGAIETSDGFKGPLLESDGNVALRGTNHVGLGEGVQKIL